MVKRKPALSDGALGDVLGYQIAKARLATHELFMRHAGEPLQLRPAEYSLLLLLQANALPTPKQLAAALGLTAPKLTIMLDKLQERGVLTRVRSDTDGRSQHVLLTEAGTALAGQCSAAAQHMEDSLQDNLSRAERAMLIELLQKVAASR